MFQRPSFIQFDRVCLIFLNFCFQNEVSYENEPLSFEISNFRSELEGRTEISIS